MVLIIFFFSKEFSLIPSAVFAAIIIDAATGIFNFKELIDIKKFSREEFYVSLICMLGVLLIGVLDGILLALILSFINLLKRASHPQEYEFVFDSNSGLIHEAIPENKSLLRNDILFYRFNSAMLFFNSDYFRQCLSERISGRDELKLIIIDASPVNYLDITFRNDLTDLIKELNQKNIKLFFCNADHRFQKKLSERLIKKNLEPEIFFEDINSALSFSK